LFYPPVGRVGGHNNKREAPEPVGNGGKATGLGLD
jgi:hypothetical protein